MSILLWHASGTGENDGVLRAILAEGVKKEFCNNDKNMQTQGIFFTASKPWATAYAERLQDPRHLYRRSGKPFVVAAAFAPSDDWDLDYELSHAEALAYLKKQKLNDFPAEKLRVTVRKKHMPSLHADTSAPEDVLADWILTSASAQDAGVTLSFRNLLKDSTPKITLGWCGAVEGAEPQSGSLACVIEQLAHHYRAQNPAAFCNHIAAEVPKGEIALKYTGANALPVTDAEVKDGIWKKAMLR